MKITNKLGLPQVLVDAAEREERRIISKRYSVTELLNAPRAVQLQRRYGNQVEEDVSDRIWALFGIAVHALIEKFQTTNISEKKMTCKIGGGTMSGIVDSYNPEKKIICDWKTTSTWTVIYKTQFESWEQQLNLYAYLLEQNGYEVEAVQNVAMLRDWSKGKARFDKNYPQSQIEVVKHRLWSKKEVEKFIKERMQLHISQEEVQDDNLPICTPEERWQDATKYAVKKNNNKRAIKLYEDKDEAIAHAESASDEKDKYWVEVRQSEPRKCEDYCSVNGFCNWYQEYKKEQGNEHL